MKQLNATRIVKNTEVSNQLSLSKTSIHRRVQVGLLPPPFSLGSNSVGGLNTEIDRVLSLMVAGKPENEIKQEVQLIFGQRQLVAWGRNMDKENATQQSQSCVKDIKQFDSSKPNSTNKQEVKL